MSSRCRTRPDNAEARQTERRRGVARAGWLQQLQLADELVVDGPGRQNDLQSKLGATRRTRRGCGQRKEAQFELRPTIRGDVETGGGGVAAVAHEQVVARDQRLSQAPALRPATGSPKQAGLDIHDRGHDGRAAGLVGQAARDQADDADRPLAADQQRGREWRVRDRGQRRGARRLLWAVRAAALRGQPQGEPSLRQGALRQPSPLGIGGLDLAGQAVRFLAILGQQQPRGSSRLSYPAGGVEARGHGEPDVIQVRFLRDDSGAAQQRGQSGSRGMAQPLQAKPCDRPVLAQDRGHVRDRPDQSQVRQVAGGVAEVASAVLAEQQLGELPGHAGAG